MNLIEGIKIVTLETHVAVPGATRQLADWGAEVIKIEAPTGDIWRMYGANFGIPTTDEENAIFTIENSNKKLISIDLKNEEGLSVIRDLLKDADAFVSNVRYASLENMHLDYDSLKDEFPQLVYYHFSSYGYKGPKSQRPGFDAAAFWASCGVLKDWSSDGDNPINLSTAFGDTIAEGNVLSGILAGLLYKKMHDGKGIRVTSSLMASGLWCNFSNLITGQPDYSPIAGLDLNGSAGSEKKPVKLGIPFSNSYKCADGRWIYVCVLEHSRGVKKVLPLLGLERWVDDPRMKTLLGFMFNEEEFYPPIIEAFASKTSDEWLRIFDEADIVVEKVAEGAEAVFSEQATANDYVCDVEFETGRHVKMVNPPNHFYGVEILPTKSAGGIGSNTREILRGHGYSEEKIEGLLKQGVIVAKD